jgi:alcohol dehydrogenase class IV
MDIITTTSTVTATDINGDYDFFAPQHIAFGWGRRAEIARIAAPLGTRAFVISGSRTLESSGRLDEILRFLHAANIRTVTLTTLTREPLVEDVDRVTSKLLGHDVASGDFVLGIGGGSALDLAKAVSAMAQHADRGSVRDFLEGVGTGESITRVPLPMLAMPTTAGTGTEATKNAVISSLDPPFKKSLRSDRMVPRAVLIDPELAISLPATTTAYTGMDALTQLIESYLSRRARPIPQALCMQGLAAAPAALLEAVRNPASRAARTTMAHVALLSGMALANSGLGFAHGVAAALGVHCGVSHGLACAVMLPAALRVNRAVRRVELTRLAELWTGMSFEDRDAGAEAAIAFIDNLCRELGIPSRLAALGVRADQIPALVTGSRGNSMAGNPREVADDELTSILEAMR